MKLRFSAIGFIPIYLGLMSCSEPDQACSMASDSVSVIDQLTVDGQDYFLIHRISGWHEKINSFELYNTQPTFNNCGESPLRPLFGASVDEKDSNNNDQHVEHIYYEPQAKFTLEYQPGLEPQTDHYRNLTLEQRTNQKND